MPDEPRLDTTRLRAELFFIHQAISDVTSRRKSLLDDLEGEPGTPSALIWRALFSDCLRAVYSVATADGEIYEIELSWMRDLLIAAAQHYTGTRDSPYGDRPVDAGTSRAFLDHYVRDPGPFGHGASIHWRGHMLCSRAEAVDRGESLQRYARLMRWLVDEACKASGVNQGHPRWRAKLPDIDELLQALISAGLAPGPEIDRRIKVFLSKAPVFGSIQKAVSVYSPDPFDVDSMHSETRQSFRRLVNQAMTQSRETSSGRTLLIVGGSGHGKTHLLRSFWSYVQEFGRGFVAYAQMDASVDDYTRYFLHHLVDSLKRPYSGRPGERTGLEVLARGLVGLKGPAFAERVDRLAELSGGARSLLDRQVNQLVDELLGHTALAGTDPDLVRVMVYALCLDPKTTPRVYQYLCCDEMTEHDRSLIGDVAPRTAREDRTEMIRKLAQLAFICRGAPLVLMLDQVELSGVDSEQAMATFQRAVDALLGIESQVGSVVVVIACLSNLYDKASKVMGRPTLDRLVKEPPLSRMSDNLSYEEIKAIVGHRLAWLFAENGAIYRATDPVYPIPEAQLRNRVNHRLRDILEWCQQFHERCVAAREIIEVGEPVRESSPHRMPPVPPLPPPPIERIALAWSEAFGASRAGTLDDDAVLALVSVAAKAYAAETGATLSVGSSTDNLLRLQFSAGSQRVELVIGVTNRIPQGGAFAAQIRRLREVSRGAVAVAVRTDAFPSGARSIQVVTDLTDAGGRAVCLDKPTLRALIACRGFQPEFPVPHVQAWRVSKRPISSLPLIAEMFGTAPLGPPSPGAPHGSSRASSERQTPGPPAPSSAAAAS
ncbi:MAG: hypothetical protein ABIY55_33090 [Kofleriaceae bacterium]